MPPALKPVRPTSRVQVNNGAGVGGHRKPGGGESWVLRAQPVLQPLRLERRWHHNSRPLWEHEHLAVNDLIFRKNIRTGFRIYLKFRVGKARLDCSEGLLFIWNGDKK